MFLKFLNLEIKNFFRSSQFATGIAMKIGMLFVYAYVGLILIGGAFGVFFEAEENGQNVLQFFAKYFLIYIVIDLFMKYFWQQLPAENIKPFLTQKITKNQIAGYTLVKILISFFSWAFLLFMIPFSLLLIFKGNYTVFSVFWFFIGTFSLVLINTFVNTIINKSNVILYSIISIIAVFGLLHYYNVIDIFIISEDIFYQFYTNWFTALLPVILLLAIGFYTFSFIKKNLYLDKGLEMKKSVGKTENIVFLNKYGTLGTFINNDIRLIKRSKAARSALIGGLLFLFYGMLFYNKGYNASFMQVFLGIFVTGGFNFMFGQRVPAWDSSYYPLMMTQNVPYKNFLKAKWALLVIAIAISMILAVGYAFISWEFYFTIFAAGLYNLGVNSYLTLLAGAYNKKPMDLNSASKGFTSGQNNFNFKIVLLMIPQILLPMAVFGGIKYFFGITPAVISLGFLGLIGFLLRDKIFDRIVKIYRTEKYSTLVAFKIEN